MNIVKYYYIILGSKYDYFKICYKDIDKIDYATYDCEDIHTNSTLKKMCYRLHTSEKINKIYKIPHKEIWNKYLSDVKIKKNLICFVFFTGTKKFQMINNGFIEYLKKEYPNSKFVCFYQDIVAVKRKLDINQTKEIFDLVISFDKNDCKNYGLTYYPDVYSKIEIPKSSNEYDIYFVGRAKNRLDKIIKAYEYFKSNNLKCNFNLIGVPKKERKYIEDIKYYKKNIPYMKVLEGINRSSAILEIMQEGAVGYTLRTCEAIMYDKLLITDNKEVMNSPFFQEKLIKVFKGDNINVSIEEVRQSHIFEKKYKEMLSPIKLIKFIDDCLNRGKNNEE